MKPYKNQNPIRLVVADVGRVTLPDKFFWVV
jgi:hypothetical protein